MTQDEFGAVGEANMVGAAVAAVVAPPTPTYVFCPEEPGVTVFGPAGKPLTFREGRLVTALTAQDAAWFIENFRNEVARGNARPRYIVWQGHIKDTDLRVLLESRVARAVGEAATVQEGSQRDEEVAFRLAYMLAADGEHVRPETLSSDAMDILRRAVKTTTPNRGPGLVPELTPTRFDQPPVLRDDSRAAQDLEIIKRAAEAAPAGLI